MNIKQMLIIVIDYYHFIRKRPIIHDENITYINWWENDEKKQWFTEFLEDNGIRVCSSLHFYSVFGHCRNLGKKVEGNKFFFTGENIVKRQHHDCLIERKEKVIPFDKRIVDYCDNINKYNMDLVLTFCTDGIKNAIRFPYWILAHFHKCYTLDDVRNRLAEIETNYRQINLKRSGAAVIASHDFFGTRAYICDSINGIVKIEYAGKWRNNTDKLWETYKNDKKKYLSSFRFNVCPENMDAKEYVTEKIWDSFDAGCIPIYTGALGNPEPQIFNRETFFLYKYDEDNGSVFKRIQEAENNDDFYAEMLKKPLFKDGADEYIYSLIQGFYDNCKRIVNGR